MEQGHVPQTEPAATAEMQEPDKANMTATEACSDGTSSMDTGPVGDMTTTHNNSNALSDVMAGGDDAGTDCNIMQNISDSHIDVSDLTPMYSQESSGRLDSDTVTPTCLKRKRASDSDENTSSHDRSSPHSQSFDFAGPQIHSSGFELEHAIPIPIKSHIQDSRHEQQNPTPVMPQILDTSTSDSQHAIIPLILQHQQQQCSEGSVTTQYHYTDQGRHYNTIQPESRNTQTTSNFGDCQQNTNLQLQRQALDTDTPGNQHTLTIESQTQSSDTSVSKHQHTIGPQTSDMDAPVSHNQIADYQQASVNSSIGPQIPEETTPSYHQPTPQPFIEPQVPESYQQPCSNLFIGPQVPEETTPNYNQPAPQAFIGPQIPESYTKSATQQHIMHQDLLDSKYSFSSSCPMRCIGKTSSIFMQQKGQDNFLRGCKWSPDGCQILTNSNDHILRTFIPAHESLDNSLDASSDEMIPHCSIKEGVFVYDFDWFPGMDGSQPQTCRVACSCSGSPMHLWDSDSGQLVASYRAFDHCDEVTSAYSLSFSPDGSTLYGGYKSAVRVFDTEYSHRKPSFIKTLNPKTKEGHTGIISCFGHGAPGSNTFVTGCYSKHVGIYYSLTNELVCLIQAQQGGVTHVMVSPDGNSLYTGGRKDPEIMCWDMRNMGRVLCTFLRDVQTNQRIYFDLSSSGRYLVSGNHDGSVQVWDTLGSAQQVAGETIMKPCYAWQAHGDCVNGVSFNQHKPLLATASGQRHFQDPGNEPDSSDDDENGHNQMDGGKDPREFSLKIWEIPCFS